MNQLQTPFVRNLSLISSRWRPVPCCCWPCPWKFSPETTATFPKPICGYSSPSASSFSPTFSSWLARSERRTRFFPPQPALSAPVDPLPQSGRLVFAGARARLGHAHRTDAAASGFFWRSTSSSHGSPRNRFNQLLAWPIFFRCWSSPIWRRWSSTTTRFWSIPAWPTTAMHCGGPG